MCAMTEGAASSKEEDSCDDDADRDTNTAALSLPLNRELEAAPYSWRKMKRPPPLVTSSTDAGQQRETTAAEHNARQGSLGLCSHRRGTQTFIPVNIP